MATGVGDRGAVAPGPAAAADGELSPRSRTRPSFETWSWYFMRISGLVLIFLALVHFSITHIVYDVVETDAAFVTARWDNPLWRAYDWTLLSLGLLHGLNGLRWIIDDYVPSAPRRAAVKAVLYSLTGFLFLLGTLTIVTYGPA